MFVKEMTVHKYICELMASKENINPLKVMTYNIALLQKKA